MTDKERLATLERRIDCLAYAVEHIQEELVLITSKRAEQTEPQKCEDCEHWNDTEDGCADRHGCKTDCSWK